MSNYGDDRMDCPECGGNAYSDSIDVGVGIYIAGNFMCDCGWEYQADGRMNVASYDDYFVPPENPDGWKPIWGFVDPPAAPDGYTIEVEYDGFLGLVISYRHVPITQVPA